MTIGRIFGKFGKVPEAEPGNALDGSRPWTVRRYPFQAIHWGATNVPRFVVLWHQLPAGHARATHWDFMLEDNGALRTWALAHSPRRGMKIEAIQLPNHRLDYLDYQGPVSGNRGHVTRVDEGTFTWRPHVSALEVWLDGRQLSGTCRLTSSVHAWTWEMP